MEEINEEEINEENKEYMIRNLNEAKEQIEKLIKELEEDPECSDGGLMISFAHAYHHINFAWNIRHVDNKKEDRIGACRQEDFDEWQRFPQDITEYFS